MNLFGLALICHSLPIFGTETDLLEIESTGYCHTPVAGPRRNWAHCARHSRIPAPGPAPHFTGVRPAHATDGIVTQTQIGGLGWAHRTPACCHFQLGPPLWSVARPRPGPVCRLVVDFPVWFSFRFKSALCGLLQNPRTYLNHGNLAGPRALRRTCVS